MHQQTCLLSQRPTLLIKVWLLHIFLCLSDHCVVKMHYFNFRGCNCNSMSDAFPRSRRTYVPSVNFRGCSASSRSWFSPSPTTQDTSPGSNTRSSRRESGFFSSPTSTTPWMTSVGSPKWRWQAPDLPRRGGPEGPTWQRYLRRHRSGDGRGVRTRIGGRCVAMLDFLGCIKSVTAGYILIQDM